MVLSNPSSNQSPQRRSAWQPGLVGVAPGRRNRLRPSPSGSARSRGSAVGSGRKRIHGPRGRVASPSAPRMAQVMMELPDYNFYEFKEPVPNPYQGAAISRGVQLLMTSANLKYLFDTKDFSSSHPFSCLKRVIRKAFFQHESPSQTLIDSWRCLGCQIPRF